MNSKMADELADEELEGLIRYYFIRGFEHMEIIHFLSKYHGKSISERTLHRRLREYGLNRRTNYGIRVLTKCEAARRARHRARRARHARHTKNKKK